MRQSSLSARLCSVIIFFLFGVTLVFAQSAGRWAESNTMLADSLKGQIKWLKIEIVKISNVDATFLRDTTVYYYFNEGIFEPEIKWSSVEAITKNYENHVGVKGIQRWPVGTKVTISRISFYDDKAVVFFKDQLGNKAVIEFIYKRSNYTSAQIRRSFAVVFSDSLFIKK